MGSSAFEIILIFVLILANGFFSASEIAIVSARKGRLEQRAEQGVRGARSALDLAESPSRFLAAVQVGITLVGTLASAFGGARLADGLSSVIATVPWLEPYAEPLALALVVLLISYFTLVLGELVPKQLALQRAEAIASFDPERSTNEDGLAFASCRTGDLLSHLLERPGAAPARTGRRH